MPVNAFLFAVRLADFKGKFDRFIPSGHLLATMKQIEQKFIVEEDKSIMNVIL